MYMPPLKRHGRECPYVTFRALELCMHKAWQRLVSDNVKIASLGPLVHSQTLPKEHLAQALGFPHDDAK